MSRGWQVVVFVLTLLPLSWHPAVGAPLKGQAEEEYSEIRGHVVDENGQPLPDAFIRFGDWSNDAGDARSVQYQVNIQPGTENVLDLDLQTGLLALSGTIHGLDLVIDLTEAPNPHLEPDGFR